MYVFPPFPSGNLTNRPRITAFQPPQTNPLTVPFPPKKNTNRTLKAVAVTLLDWSESKRVVPSWWVKASGGLDIQRGWWLPRGCFMSYHGGDHDRSKVNCFTDSPFQKMYSILTNNPIDLCFSRLLGSVSWIFMNFHLSSTVGFPAFCNQKPPLFGTFFSGCAWYPRFGLDVYRKRFCTSRPHPAAVRFAGQSTPKDPLRTLLPGSGWVKLTCIFRGGVFRSS